MKKRFLIHDNYHNKGRNMSASKVVKKHIGVLLCIFMMMFSVIPSGIIKAETSTSTLSSSVKYGDLNGDGKINSIDLALMQRFILGKITKFPADKSTGTITDIKPKLVEGLKAKSETISIIYTGDTTDLKNQLNQLVSATLKEDANGYNVASIQYSASGTAGNLTITFKIEYTAEVQGAKTIDEVKSKLIEGLTAKQQKIEVTYTGDVTDLSNNISQLVATTLSEDSQGYNVKTSSCSMSGTIGNVTITFEFTYSDEAIIIVNTLEEMKTTLIQNFKNKGAN